jgi:opacity protein-like surface antigen
MKRFSVIAIVVATLFAAPAFAKEGAYIGAYVVPTAKISGSGFDDGSGYGFRAGLGFNRYFALEGSIEMVEHDFGGGSADVTGAAVDAKINFPLTSLDSANVMTLEPYIRLGIGASDIDNGGGSSSSGTGLRFGFGIELYLFRELSVNAGWTDTDVSYDNPDRDADVRNVDVGLTYHFM